MAKFKGAKWAQILTLMAAIAASIVSQVSDAKTYAKNYADGLKAALVAGDIKYTSANFNSGAETTVAAALEELLTRISSADITVDQSTTTSGMLSTTVIKKNGVTIGTINIPKDYVNNILGLVTITEGTGDDAGKYFDGATEVGAADGVTGAGIYLKSKEDSKDGSADDVFKYADMSNVVEYVTSGSQAGDMVVVAIDSNTHQVTASITDGTVTKAKLVSSVQSSLDKADSALQEADFEWATDSEVNTAWAAAMTAAQTPAQSSGE